MKPFKLCQFVAPIKYPWKDYCELFESRLLLSLLVCHLFLLPFTPVPEHASINSLLLYTYTPTLFNLCDDTFLCCEIAFNVSSRQNSLPLKSSIKIPKSTNVLLLLPETIVFFTFGKMLVSIDVVFVFIYLHSLCFVHKNECVVFESKMSSNFWN